jgi:hypothetical protein
MACRIRNNPLADDQHDRDEAHDLGCGQSERERDCPEIGTALVSPRQQAGNDRQEDEREHHGDVLDDEPAHRDPPPLGLDQPPLLHRAEQDDGARHRKRKSEHEPGTRRPAEPGRKPHAEQRRAQNLRDGSGDGDRLDREKIVER